MNICSEDTKKTRLKGYKVGIHKQNEDESEFDELDLISTNKKTPH
jgi:hypothetical protein